MDRDERVKIIFFRIKIIVAQVINQNGVMVRIDDPVLFYSGVLILVKLEQHVFCPRGGREDLQREVRGSVESLCSQIIGMTDQEDIRLDHRLIIAVQPDITWSNKDFAFAFTCIGALTEQDK